MKEPISAPVAFLLAMASVTGMVILLSLVFDGDSGRRRASAQNACINNLRKIDGAKEQWIDANSGSIGHVPTQEEVSPYLGAPFPSCPFGGEYRINAVSVAPTCSVEGHRIQ